MASNSIESYLSEMHEISLNKKQKVETAEDKERQEENRIFYSQLPEQIIGNLMKAPNDKFEFVKKFLIDISAGEEKSQKKFSELENQKRVTNMAFRLYNNPVRDKKPISNEQKMAKRTTIKTKEQRDRKLFEIPPELHVYSMYIPLHNLWSQYISDVIGTALYVYALALLISVVSGSKVEAKVVKADLHGSIMKVTKSKCPTNIGLSGIMIKETENTFNIITPDNKLKVIPKANNVFTIQLPTVVPQVVTLYGNHFCYRTFERTAKKMKSKNTIEL